MANTYTQINIHAVFATKGRENFILNSFNNQLFQYISGILKNINQFPLAVNGHKDHVHVFFELKSTDSVSNVLQILKTNSSKWINESKFLKGKFNWQNGYGAFSYSKSQRNDVIQYIINQEEHHKSKVLKLNILNY